MAIQTLNDGLQQAESAFQEGNFTKAVSLYLAVLPHVDGEFGLDHDIPWQTRLMLGLSLYGLGRFAEAEMYHRRALEGRDRLLGTDHPDTIRTRCRLADAIGEQGRWEEAEAIAQQAIRLGEAKGLLSDDGVLMARMTVAWIRLHQEQADEAAQLATSVYTDLERSLGTEHRLTLSAGNLLAECLQNIGDLEGAEGRASQVYRGRIALLGPEHPHTVAIAHDLAGILVAAGKVSEAASLATNTLPIAQRVLGDAHRWTAGLREVVTQTSSGQEEQ
ncbi:tetratricopeptide repeat protein [Streptomyces sp. NPDC001155]